jgi:hypothetical protein
MFPSNMRTGRQTTAVSPAADDLDPQTVTKIKIILNRYMVEAVKDAAEYCHAAGRNTLTATDIEYALKYQAHEFVIDDALLTECEQEFEQNPTKPTRTLWADEVETDEDDEGASEDDEGASEDDEGASEDDEDDEEEASEDDEEDDEGASEDEYDLEVDDDEEPFTRCTDTSNEKVVKMNRYYDEWDAWVPDTDLHKSVKKSIDKTFGGV